MRDFFSVRSSSKTPIAISFVLDLKKNLCNNEATHDVPFLLEANSSPSLIGITPELNTLYPLIETVLISVAIAVPASKCLLGNKVTFICNIMK